MPLELTISPKSRLASATSQRSSSGSPDLQGTVLRATQPSTRWTPILSQVPRDGQMLATLKR